MPTFTITTILAAATTSTTTASKKSGTSSEYFLVILVVFVGVYFLFLRPRQQKAKAARSGAGRTLAVGDEVVTIGGILGTVSSVDGDSVSVEVAPGTHMSFLLRAVNLRTAVPGAPRTNPVADADDGPDEYETYDDDDESWEDEDAAGDVALDHPGGSGSTALDDGGPHELTGDTGDGPDNDRGGRGEGRRR